MVAWLYSYSRAQMKPIVHLPFGNRFSRGIACPRRRFKRCPRWRDPTMAPRAPRLDPSTFVHPLSSIIGDVTFAANTSVWPFASIRGDVDPIVIGEGSNVQDGCVIHTDHGFPV